MIKEIAYAKCMLLFLLMVVDNLHSNVEIPSVMTLADDPWPLVGSFIAWWKNSDLESGICVFKA